ncbi:MAG: Nif3-like dinuclear metal center hexameric protein [Fimbriimonadaceae bacterium]
MPRVSDILEAIGRIAPHHEAYPWDKIGLQVGDPSVEVGRVLVTLDASRAAIREAAAGSQMIVAHHPVIWEPLARLDGSYSASRAVELARHSIALAVAHTNWDCARGGVNDALAARIGLRDVRPVGRGAQPECLKLTVTVPKVHTQAVLDAIAAAGAGQIGAYRRCAFWAAGKGTFQPMEGANPRVGSVGSIENVEEDRLEAVLERGLRTAVEEAVLQSHPYEVPAYDFHEVSVHGTALARIGELERPMAAADFARHVGNRLGGPTIGYGSTDVRLVVVVGGAGGDYWRLALDADAAFVTGEAKHHEGLEAAEAGTTLVAAGHYATEQPGVEALRNALATQLPEVEFRAFTPEPGQAGRPQ